MLINEQNKKNKLDLLGFQKALNDQFLEIFESKKLGTNRNEDSVSDLGLGDKAFNLNFFFPLKELRNISMDNNYEEMPLTKSWISGFNQTRGEVFTILDFNKIIEFIATGKLDDQKRKLNNDSRIIYVKDSRDSKVGFLLSSLELEYTAEFTKIFSFEETTEKFHWYLAEDIDFETFVKEQKMTEHEWNIMSQLHALVLMDTEISKSQLEDKFKNIATNQKEDNVYLMVKEVYLDQFGQHPVFVLNLENLTKYLINVSPY